jgi:hypothetical protein
MDPVDALKAQMKQTEKQQKVKLLTPSEVTSFVAAIQKSNPLELGKFNITLLSMILYKLCKLSFARSPSYLHVLENQTGSLDWVKRAKMMFDLDDQSSFQVNHCRRQSVLEEMILQAKLPVLVHEIILMEQWKKNILPEVAAEFPLPGDIVTFMKHPIVQLSLAPFLRYELVCLQILENALYHDESLEALGEALLHLTGYALRCLRGGLEQLRKSFMEAVEDKESYLMMISKNVALTQVVDCVTILHGLLVPYFNNPKKCGALQEGFISRLFLSNDGPMIISDFILCQPWEKGKKRQIPLFDLESVSWCQIEPFTKDVMDAGAFRLLRQMCVLEKVQKESSYPWSDARKEKVREVIKCLESKKWLSEKDYKVFKTLLDELDFESLMLYEVGGAVERPQNLLEVTSFPFLEKQLEKVFNEDHNKILEQNLKELLDFNSDAFKEKVKIWLEDLGSSKLFDPSVLPQVHVCANCDAEGATKLCSACKEEWYCSRECQKSHWKKAHKKSCSLSNGMKPPRRRRLILG